jgi:MFS transporter, MHS family, proline/betaine transporter
MTKAMTQIGLTTPVHQPLRRVVVASVVGTVVEYYDFAVYGYMATVLASLFFNAEDPTAALLGTLAAFAVSFALRIPGGILFGHIGDKYGRKVSLFWTILLMCAATAGMGLLPTYFAIGIWATVLLVTMRFLQGIAAGGELGGATAFVAESAPAAKRAAFTSLVNVGISVGSLFASLAALSINSVFTPEQVNDFAWRLPFLFSLPLALVGLWIRSRLHDTPQFEKLRESHEVEAVPIVTLVKQHKGSLGRIAALSALFTGGHYVVYTYGPIHLQRSGGHDASFAFLATSISLVICAFVIPLAGALSDRIGRRPVFLLAGALGVVAAVPAFMLMGSGSQVLAVLGQILLGLPVSLSIGPAFASFAENLPAKVRYSGISLGMNVAQLVVGGTAPLIATWLVATTGAPLSPAALYGFCALCVLIGGLKVKETARQELPVT